METKANYVLIGAFTLLATVFLLLFVLWAAKFSADRNWREYQVIFTEPVTGLTQGSSVQYNGITVGTVDRLSLAPEDARKVVAKLKLQADAPVKVDTKAKMSQQGITGQPFIQLTGGSPEAPALVPRERGDIPVIRTEPSALQNIADTANRLVLRLDEILSEDNIANVSKTLENLETATGAIAGQRDNLEATLVSMRASSDSLKQTLQTTNGAVERLDREVIRELPALVDKLDRSLAQLEGTTRNANALISENRAPIAAFTRDGLQQIGPTMSELRSTTRELRKLMERMDGNPAGYVLGRSQPKEFEPK